MTTVIKCSIHLNRMIKNTFKIFIFFLCSYHSDGNEQVSKCLLEDLRIKFPEEDISLLQSIIYFIKY